MSTPTWCGYRSAAAQPAAADPAPKRRAERGSVGPPGVLPIGFALSTSTHQKVAVDGQSARGRRCVCVLTAKPVRHKPDEHMSMVGLIARPALPEAGRSSAPFAVRRMEISSGPRRQCATRSAHSTVIVVSIPWARWFPTGHQIS